MKLQRAINLAISSMKKEIQRCAFDASIADRGETNPSAVNAQKRRDDLRQSISKLAELERA